MLPSEVNGGKLVTLLNEGSLPMPFVRDILLIRTFVAGTAYVPGIGDLVSRMEVGERLTLVREPQNRFDSMAIRVDTSHGTKLGYVPRKDNHVIASLMDAGKQVFATVVSIHVYDPPPSIEVDVMMRDGITL